MPPPPPGVGGPSVVDGTSAEEGPAAVTGPSMGGGSPADGVPPAEDGCSVTGMSSSGNKPEPSTVQHDREHLDANEQVSHDKGEELKQKDKHQTAGIGKKPVPKKPVPDKGKSGKREQQQENLVQEPARLHPIVMNIQMGTMVGHMVRM